MNFKNKKTALKSGFNYLIFFMIFSRRTNPYKKTYNIKHKFYLKSRKIEHKENKKKVNY